jgi:hypothetical protein
MDDTVDYCRQIESYLCRKNGGHLIRIVGPAFERVRDWAGQGIPVKVAFRGIDRCCERAHARGGRRRPMRIEFCEADVLAAFDDWRRAIGIIARQVGETADATGGEEGSYTRKGALVTHIQRCVTRLLAPKGVGPDAEYDAMLRRVTEELDGLALGAKEARGDARAEVIRRLAELDAALIAAAHVRIEEQTASALRSEADAELAGFVDRMPADAFAHARQRAFERLLRDALNLPVLSYE